MMCFGRGKAEVEGLVKRLGGKVLAAAYRVSQHITLRPEQGGGGEPGQVPEQHGAPPAIVNHATCRRHQTCDGKAGVESLSRRLGDKVRRLIVTLHTAQFLISACGRARHQAPGRQAAFHCFARRS